MRFGLAILELENPDDACPLLMDLLCDEEQDLAFRRSAAVSLRCALGRRDERHHDRVASIYRSATDHELRHQLQRALEESRAPGVTEAMIHHALTWHGPKPGRAVRGADWSEP